METELINHRPVSERNIFVWFIVLSHRCVSCGIQKIRYVNFKKPTTLSLKKIAFITENKRKIKQILKNAPALFVRAGPKYVNSP